VNGNPARPVPLTERGREQARGLGLELAGLPLELCLHTRFGRTHETAEMAVGERPVPLVAEPLLDDVNIGELEGATLDDYRAWKEGHTRDDPFPGGESLNEAARRYSLAFRRLVESESGCVLVVCHEIPIRYALNAIAGSDDLDAPAHDIPNATPFMLGEGALAQAAERIEELAQSSAA
jgi:broad specificity phosphatase PhoE